MKIWVIAEKAAQCAELTNGARQTADCTQVHAFVGGSAEEAQNAATCGADLVTSIPLPDSRPWEDYALSLAERCKTEQPALILVSATKRGKALAATLAALCDAPCITECASLHSADGQWTATRMVYGGLAVKTVSTTAPLLLATLGPGTFEAAPAGAPVAVDSLPLTAAATVTVTGRDTKSDENAGLSDADRVVGVGRGFGEETELQLARDLAQALKAELGCSRPIAEFFKWMPEERYIGISGQVIKPQIYFAVGISGQSQHLSGVHDAKIIVCVNKDENAPILAQSDYAIVGDIAEVLPALTQAFKQA